MVKIHSSGGRDLNKVACEFHGNNCFSLLLFQDLAASYQLENPLKYFKYFINY